MSVSVDNWKNDPRSWMVTVRIKWPSGKKLRDRKVVSDMTKKQALTWGEDRQRELLIRGEAKVEEEKAAKTPGAITSKWYERYYRLAETGEVGRKNQGRAQAAIADRRARFRNWVEPEIGHLEMRAVSPKELRRIVATLDAQIKLRRDFYAGAIDRDPDSGAKPGISAKTAAHIWSEITSGFREALRSKIEDLRIEGLTDPTASVQPPMRTDERAQAALYPREVLQLLSCEEVPLHRRRLYALAIYTGARLSELGRITAAHVDFEHKMIQIVGKKTQAATRRVPIEGSLLPLLKVLVQERPGGPLVDCPRSDGGSGAAALIHEDLATAKLTRADLYADTEFAASYVFHSHRHTAITHGYMAGRDETYLKIVYGHTMTEMTRRYLDAAMIGRATFGQPFPPLPASVLGGAKVIPLARRKQTA